MNSGKEEELDDNNVVYDNDNDQMYEQDEDNEFEDNDWYDVMDDQFANEQLIQQVKAPVIVNDNIIVQQPSESICPYCKASIDDKVYDEHLAMCINIDEQKSLNSNNNNNNNSLTNKANLKDAISKAINSPLYNMTKCFMCMRDITYLNYTDHTRKCYEQLYGTKHDGNCNNNITKCKICDNYTIEQDSLKHYNECYDRFSLISTHKYENGDITLNMKWIKQVKHYTNNNNQQRIEVFTISIPHFVDIFTSTLTHNSSNITVIDFSKNLNSVHHMDAFIGLLSKKRMPRLKTLNLSSNDIHWDTFITLIRALENLNVEKLIVSGNQFDRLIVPLDYYKSSYGKIAYSNVNDFQELPKLPASLRLLDMSECNIKDDHIRKFKKSLSNVETLILDKNFIDKGFKELGGSFNVNKIAVLSANYQIGEYVSIGYIVFILQEPCIRNRLRELRVNQNKPALNIIDDYEIIIDNASIYILQCKKLWNVEMNTYNIFNSEIRHHLFLNRIFMEILMEKKRGYNYLIKRLPMDIIKLIYSFVFPKPMPKFYTLKK